MHTHDDFVINNIRNCNCFSEAATVQLLGHSIPPHVNRLANWGSCFSCLIPSENEENESSSFLSGNVNARKQPSVQRFEGITFQYIYCFL